MSSALSRGTPSWKSTSPSLRKGSRSEECCTQPAPSGKTIRMARWYRTAGMPTDGAALRACWHPVGYGADVGDAPRATTLLGEPLALWRDTRGDVHAFRDVCVHRGTALSLGCVEGDEIVCAYHGW